MMPGIGMLGRISALIKIIAKRRERGQHQKVASDKKGSVLDQRLIARQDNTIIGPLLGH